MLYERYEQRVIRNFSILKQIYKYKVHIITIISIVSLMLSGYSFSKGVIYEVSVPSEIVFGEVIEVSSKSVFSSVSYSYRYLGDTAWEQEAPLRPGDYQLRISSKKVFGRKNEEIVNFEIVPKVIELNINNLEVPFGSPPQLSAEFYEGDYIDSVQFSYEDLSLTETIVNVESLIIKDSLGNIVGTSYNTMFTPKRIIFVPRPITVKPIDASHIYDAAVLTSNVAEVIEGNLINGHHITIETTSNQIDVGSTSNEISSIHVWQDNIDVTDNYDITYDTGTLEVEPRPITISSATDSKIYDGTVLFNREFNITEGSLVAGHASQIIEDTSVVTAGVYNNDLKVSITAGDTDVTNNYTIYYEKGTLEITPRVITITTDSAEKIYDGLELFNQGYAITEGTLATGQVTSLIEDTRIFDVSTFDNDITIHILSDEIDVSDNYEINYITGTLQVTPIMITVSTNSDNKVYDGTDLYNQEYVITEGTLAVGQTSETELDSRILDVGVIDNDLVLCISENDNDVTSNYEITYVTGTLEITPREIIVLTSDASKIYDGNELLNQEYTITEGTVAPGQVSHVIEDTRIVDVSAFDNELTLTILNDEIDVTSNYDITYVYGTLEINPRELTIQPLDASKIYDEILLISSESEITSGSLVEGQTVTITTDGSQINVGTSLNEIVTLIITSDEIEKTSNYSITYETGALEVTPRQITIETFSDSKVYDGTELLNQGYSITEGTLTINQAIEVTEDTSITTIGTVENDLLLVIMDNEVDVTSNYDIIYVAGTLEITPRPITITSIDDTKVYDGTELLNHGYSITGGLLADNQSSEVIEDTRITNVGIIDNDLLVKVVDVDNNDVTSNYNVTYITGTLEVTLRQITIKAVDKEKTYDGTEITSSDLEVIEGSVATGEVIIITTLGSQTNVGVGSNPISSVLITNDGTNVTSNYEITYGESTLEITPKPVTITTWDDEKVYDGTELYNPGYSITEGDLVEGHSLEVIEDSRITDVGVIDNVLSLIVNDELTDTSNNYDITYITGILEITKQAITIHPDDVLKIYDGNVLISNNAVVSGGEVVFGHTVSITTSGSQTNVGISFNSITSSTIWNNEVDVTNNYNITYETGTLEVLSRPIVVTTSDASKVYDGTALLNQEYEITEGSLAIGQVGIITEDTSIINVNFVDNILELSIFEDEINVTSNYEITYITGTLEITPRSITVTAANDTKVYDATELINQGHIVSSGTLAEEQSSVVVDNTSIINVGTIDNVLEVTIKDSENIDVTSNYVITYVAGTLEITHRPITITAADDTEVYDGTALSNQNYTVTEGSFADGQIGIVIEDSSITNIGSIDNNLIITVMDGTTNVTSNYDITYVEGILVVTPRPITITTADDTKNYDGTELFNQGYIISQGSIADGQNATVTEDTRIVIVGSLNNELVLLITSEDGDVTSNYDIEYITGTLEITPKPITITTWDDEKVYDGTELYNPGYSITEGDLVEGHSLEVIEDSRITDVGVIDNVISLIVNDELTDTSSNYDITYITGTLEITKREVTIQPDDLSRIYDGNVLISNNAVVSGGEVVFGHTVSITTSGSQTNVGISFNSITSASIWNDDIDVTSNYDITYESGILEVLKRLITVQPMNSNKTYDGTALTSNVANITGNLAPGQSIIITTSGSQTNAGISSNNISTLSIWANGIETTSNYDITETTGLLEVFKRPITIKPLDAQDIFNGTALTSNIVEVLSGSVVSGHNIVITTSGSQTIAGISDNFITSTNVWNAETDVTSNYDITTESGTLEVLPQEITVKPIDRDEEYNGTALTSNIAELSRGVLANGHQVFITTTGSQTDVGNTNSVITSIHIWDGDVEVTSKYDITLETGSLVVTKRPITIQPKDIEQEYNGTLVTSDVAEVTNGSVVYGQSIVITTSGSQLNVGTNTSTITDYSIWNDEVDVTSNYDITIDIGTISVLPRRITISPEYTTKVYDGSELVSDVSEVVSGSLVAGQNLIITTNGSQTIVGTSDNEITDASIWNGISEVTYNYLVTYVIGTLEVTPRPITLMPTTQSQIYDGSALTPEGVEITQGNLVAGHTIISETTGSQTNAGISTSTITDASIWNGETEVTNNYEITYETGVLEVIPRPITVTSEDDSKIYDGTELYNQGYDITENTLVFGHYSVVIDDTRKIDAGSYDNELELQIIYDEEDMTSNYDITYVTGTLVITPRPITITTASDEKVYDGTELFNLGYTITNGTLVSGHNSVLVGDTRITNKGIYENHLVVNIMDGELDVSHNYNIIYDNGNLEITPRLLTVTTASDSKVYDGTELFNLGYEIINGTLVAGQTSDIKTDRRVVDVGEHINDLVLGIFALEEDVSENYKITYQYGTLEITARPIKFATASDEKVYDGTDLYQHGFTLIEGSLIEGHTSELLNDTKEHNVGIFVNDLVIGIIFGEDNMTNNYAISYDSGTLEITPRPITIYPQNKTEIYDGADLTSNVAIVSGGSLIDGHEITLITSGSQKNVGVSVNPITSAQVWDQGTDITYNYNISYDDGVLEVLHRAITIKPEDVEKTYDGLATTSNETYYESGTLAPGQTILLTTNSSITNVGSITNEILTVTITDGVTETTSNYTITLNTGTLKVNARLITIKPIEISREYDGTELVSNEAYYIDGSLANGQNIVLTTTGSIMNVGETPNSTLTYNIFADGIETTSNYTVTTKDSRLEVTSRLITIKLIDISKTYDGTELTSNAIDYIVGNLAPNQNILTAASGSQTEIGSSDNLSLPATIWSGELETTSNYSITYQDGTLEVTHILITIKPVDKIQVFDGEALTSNEVEVIDGNLLETHTIVITTSGSQIQVGTSSNPITSYQILDGETDVTTYYDVTTGIGSLEVYEKIKITISTNDASKVYDGTPLTDNQFVLSSGSLKEGHTLTVTVTGTITNPGQMFNEFNYQIKDELNNDMSAYYVVTENVGTLEVTILEQAITIMTESDSKVYDGTPLISDVWSIIDGELLPNHTLSVTVTGTITEVGESGNTFTYTILDENNNDVTEIVYSITKVTGSLVIFDEDGNGTNTDTDYQISDQGSFEPTGDLIGPLFRIYSETTDTVYLRDKSYGDYTGTGFEAPPVYTSPFGINPLRFPSLAVNGSIESYLLQVQALRLGLSYYLPYYAVDGYYDNLNDVYLNHTYGLGYNVNYIPINNIAYQNYTLTGTIYEAYEIVYRTHVYDTYLQLPESTRLAMLDIAARNGLSSDSATIIEDVKNYIQNAANYNLQFNPMPDNVDYSVYFLEESREGICQHFAMAATTMYRSMGIPARYVTGFTQHVVANEWADVTGMQAHAWVEVYIDGFGWVPQEVTAGGLEGGSGSNTGSDPVVINENLETITITSQNDSKAYDGDTLTNENYIAVGTLQEGHILIIDMIGSITQVGETDNEFIAIIIDGVGSDVSDQYNIKSNFGTLVVTPNNGLETIEIQVDDITVEYDGITHEHSPNDYSIPSNNLPEGYTIDFDIIGEITDVGTISTYIDKSSIRIYDESNVDVTHEYTIVTYEGSIEITKLEITIKPVDNSKIYNGTELTSNEVEFVLGNLMDGHSIEITTSGSQTEVGTGTNPITSVHIYDGEIDVTNNYKVNTMDGNLTILEPVKITVSTNNDSKVYDGTPLTDETWELTSGTILEGHTLTVTVTGTITYPGEDFNTVEYQILDENGADVSVSYIVTEDIGILEITVEEQELTILSESDSKVYDGTPLTNVEWNIIKGELLPNHTVSVTITGTITEVGSEANVFTYTIYDENDNDVTEILYKVTAVKGKLLVFDEDGNGSNSNTEYIISSQGWFESDGELSGTLFKIYSETTDMIYLRDKSYGDYTGTGFEAPSVYNSPYGVNPLQFPGLAINGTVSATPLQVQALSMGLSYYLPYYAVDGYYDNINDVYLTHDYGLGYDVNYIPINDVAYQDYSLVGTQYEAYELEYRNYVYNTYLQLPESTRLSMLDIAARNGLTSGSATIVADVKNYIQNAANYNLQFKPMPDNVDYSVYFLEVSREGICQHFAMAATTMYRSMGIPARYVTGYAQQTVQDEWVDVTVLQAHAWVEIYIDGFGWVPQEVTAGGLEGSFGTGSGSESDPVVNDENLETITITSANDSKPYDGTALVNGNYTTEGTLEAGHTLLVDMTGSITQVGETENLFTATIIDGAGNDVSDQYNIESNFGTLVVTPNNSLVTIEIQVYDVIEEYDGTVHKLSLDDYWIKSNNLPVGYTLTLEIAGEISEVGTISTYVIESSLRIYNVTGDDVTNLFNIVTYDGSLEVVPRNITISLFPVQKQFDGTPLTSDAFYIANGSLVEGHTVTVTSEGSIIEVGMTANIITSVIILDENGNDVTKNYDITPRNGLLIVLE